MPGVIIDTTVRSGPPLGAAPDIANYFVVGLSDRGDTAGVETITSLADFEAKCGGRTTYGFAYDDLKVFFAEGGSRAYFARVVGPAATKATVSLSDGAHPTLSVTARDAGSAGATLAVRVEAGSQAQTFRMVVALSGTDVETHDNLATPTDAVNAFIGSPYVVVADLASVSVAPANQPSVVGSTSLTGGADDRASVTTAMLIAALGRFDRSLGAGAVAIPGYPANLVGQGVKDHCKANRRIGYLAPALGQTVAQVVTLADTLDGADGDCLGLFYPWVLVPDGAGTRVQSPEGFAAGLRARELQANGPGTVPAGAAGVATFVSGVNQSLTRAQGDQLDGAKVSAIRVITIGGAHSVRLYGYRSLSTDVQNFPLLKTRDLLNYATVAAEDALEPLVFRIIDGRGVLATEAAAALIAICEPLRAAGVVYENPGVDRGYRVDTGPAVNTPTTLSRQEFHAYMGFRDSPVGELIVVSIVKVGLAAAV